MAATIIIEFQPDFSKIQSATEQIKGELSQPVIDEFKKVQSSIDATATSAGGSIGKMASGIEKVSVQMANGLKDGLKDGLRGAAAALEKDLKKITDSFRGVSKSGDLKAITAQLKTFLTALKTESRPEVIKAYTVAVGELETEVEKLKNGQGGAASATKSLKLELRELTASIAAATLEGKNSGPEFQAMVDRAGEIKDAMGDAASQINTFASDTAKLDETIGIVTGVAAAFSIAQGATALLGNESKELQEALVRVQAAQAILNGLTEVSNLLEKQSAAYKAVSRVQSLAAAAAKSLETAAESKNILIRGAAILSQKALNAVMKANPVFILIGAFTLLGGALAFFSTRSKDAANNSELLNLRLEEQNRILEGNLKAIDDAGEIRLARMKQQGATEAQLHVETVLNYARSAASLRKSVNDRIMDLKRLEKQQFTGINNLEGAQSRLDAINHQLAEGGEDISKSAKEFLEDRKKILTDIVDKYSKLSDIQVSISKKNAAFASEQAEKDRQAAKEAQDKRDAAAKEAAEKAKEAARQRLADVKADIERELLTVEDGSRKQLELKKSLAAAEKDLSAFDAKSSAEKKLIYAQYLKALDDLTTEFFKEQKTKAIQSQIDTLTAQLANDRIGAQEREALTVELLNRQRELELSQVINNKAKEKEINARFDAEISAQRLAIRQKEFAEELALEEAKSATKKRRLQQLADDENASLPSRLLAISDLENRETQSIEKQMDNNERLHNARLITDKAYETAKAELESRLTQVTEDAEKKRTDITATETQKRIDKAKEEMEQVLGAAEQIIGSINSIAQAFADRAAANIEGQKRELDQLKEAGAITEKEFLARQKRLEAAELAAKRRAAVREKAVALFTAGIQGARAIIEAAPNPVMIALTAALVAAQLISIASKPIPKFSKGTKRAPRGFAEVAETGAEIIRDDKGYHLVEHPQIVWLKGGEQIYNPKETRDMFSHETPLVKADLTKPQVGGSGGPAIDYKKLTRMFGEEIARHPRNIINLDQNGFSQFTIDRMNKTRYLNKRYTFNG